MGGRERRASQRTRRGSRQGELICINIPFPTTAALAGARQQAGATLPTIGWGEQRVSEGRARRLAAFPSPSSLEEALGVTCVARRGGPVHAPPFPSQGEGRSELGRAGERGCARSESRGTGGSCGGGCTWCVVTGEGSEQGSSRPPGTAPRRGALGWLRLAGAAPPLPFLRLPGRCSGRRRRLCPGPHGFSRQRDGGGARVGADPAQAGGADVHLPVAVPGPGSRAEPGLGHGRPPVLPVPVGVLPQARQLGQLALRVHPAQRLADSDSRFAFGRCDHHSHSFPDWFDLYLCGVSEAVLQTTRSHALCSSCSSGVQPSPLSSQVHRDSQLENIP